MCSKFRLLRWPIALSLVAFTSYVVNVRSARGGRFDLRHSASNATRMMPIQFSNGIVGRTILPLATGDCVVMHVPPQYTTQESLRDALKPSDDPKNQLEIYHEPTGSRWHVAENDLSEYSTFNCATFALGDVMDLKKSDWLELRPTSWTKGLSPTALVLENYFHLVATFPWSAEHSSPIEPGLLKPGDVVLFTSPQGSCHIGRICETNLGKTLASKLGHGPLVQGSIEATAKRYHQHVNAIQIYRRRGTR